ncbi:sialate O-acetylesterase [Dyadobacter sp. CY312]|uniref:sialate O-acetylesterase n=1 Tax=Dyadobacter sp. CY312 TaxID=2907303 RepID=UPI001F39EB70|nr:sialate O-acetylesterase [Dyadobacter sp. CY312]MCE7040529.1 sialate O-acetylesterase [Dyadobacter sp. CY312]
MHSKFYKILLFSNVAIVLTLVFQLTAITSRAERIYSVVFNKLPQDYQLYPRNANNEANVPVSGYIELAGYNYMSVQVFRNEVPVKYLRADIKYDSKGIGSFSTSAIIKAELAQYSFKVYACKTADSVLMTHRKNIVSGDVYLLTGQSNSTGFFTESETSEYCRSFGKITDNLNTAAYNPADTLWALSNQQNTGASVGTMGLKLQKQLVAKSGIPNCLINGGFHWSSAFAHAQRTESNPADLNNGYGRMLYRVQKAGLKDAVKAFIFRQGETEAYHEGADWEGNFDKLRKNLHLDLPNLKMLYVFQIDIIYYPSLTGTALRDYQRRLPEIYPDVKSLATVGTVGFDGLHYDKNGNKQGGSELARLVERDFYQLKDTLNINSPAVRKAFYSNDERKQLIITFDEGQQLIYPEKYKPDYSSVTLDMKDFFYLNHNSG